MRSLPLWANTVVGVSAGERVEPAPTEQAVEPAAALHVVVAGLAEQPRLRRRRSERVVASAAEQLASRSAPLVSLNASVSLPPPPMTTTSEVLATVGVPSPMAIAPLLTRIVPAAVPG